MSMPVRVKREKKARDVNAEVESDSDPIVESSTNSESGEDDGVSWPSDDEGGAPVSGYKAIDERRAEAGSDGGEATDGDEAEGGEGGVEIPPHPSRASNVAAASNNANSRESHAKQKVLVQERRAAKPNADGLARSKKIWERIRRKSHVPRAERQALVGELFALITGRVREFVLKHDASRVIQTALKYGSAAQRRMVAEELRGEFHALAEGRYAKFLVGKLLSYGDEAIRDLVVPDFYGRVRRMIRHPEASWILDDVYRGAATRGQKAVLLREWFGAEYAIFQKRAGDAGETTAELEEIFARNPEKRSSVMRYLWEMINQLVQKKTTAFTMLHDAMLQYHLNVTPGSEEANEFLELLKGDEEGDLMKNLAFTKPGARVASLAFAHGTAKDRKLLLRVYKDTVKVMAYDINAHQVLLCACEVIDDTVLLSKSIFGELLPKDVGEASEEQLQDLLGMVTDLNSRPVVLLPFSSKPKAILSDSARAVLDEVYRIRTATSRKDPEVRKKELAKAASPALVSLIAQRAGDLATSGFGCHFMTEVLVAADGDRRAALQAIADIAAGPETRRALETPFAGKMLKTLVQGGHFDHGQKKVLLAEPPLCFADMLCDAIEASLLEWAKGVGAFTVVSLLESQAYADATRVEKLKARLRQRVPELQAIASLAPQAREAAGVARKRKADARGSDAEGGQGAIAAKGVKRILEILEG